MLPGLERHPHARAVLTPALPPEGAPSHAYLFHGPAGAGKRDVARAFAAALLADGAADPDNARLRAEHGVHPDLTWVTPSGAAEMLVSDIDEPVVAAAARTPFESRRRVFVIERVDTMHENAANRMLKTLEEPPPFAHLLLLTDRPQDVLPTILSRCQAVRFDAPRPDDLAAMLTGTRAWRSATATALARSPWATARSCAPQPSATRAPRCTAAASPTLRTLLCSSRPRRSPTPARTRSRPRRPRSSSTCPRRTTSASSASTRSARSACTAARTPACSTTRCSSPGCGTAT
ncbi:MAG: hypothetical protein E6G41_00055 [Actinobacteria bacterium]|nr:MAG: hypothetical protein E6G41_00055 [Actinomycetota bacterium]